MIAKMTQMTTGVVANNLDESPVETLETITMIVGVKIISSIGRNRCSKSHLPTAFIIHEDSIPRSSGCQS